MDLPYRAEYAKSGRASCRSCKSPIEKEVLRLAVMVQSHMFDGKTPQWYHADCFFIKQRPKTENDIAHFEALRWEDQESIRKKIVSGASIVVPQKKGKKRDAATAANNKAALKDFVIEYSKSSRAECRGCGHKIMKGEVRTSKKDFETDVGKRYGGQDMWHHLTCFTKLRSELGYFESGDKLPGFNSLKPEDKKDVKNQLPAIKQEDVPIKKPKIEDQVDSAESALNKEIKSQNDVMFDYRDQIKDFKRTELQHLLEYNKEAVPIGVERMLDRLADVMTFGALEKCKECKTGQFVFNKLGYICKGDLTEWTKCETITKEPKRRKFKIPSDLAEKYTFLKQYKYVPRTRVIKDLDPANFKSVVKTEQNKEEVDAGPKIVRQGPPLYNMEFVIVGKFEGTKDELKQKILRLGGKVITKISKSIMAVISTPEEVERKGARIREAEDVEVHIVPEDFVDKAKEYYDRIPELIIEKSICSWGTDPNLRLPPKASSSKSKSKSGSMFTRSIPSKIKLKLKNGGAVDPESGLEDCAHIYQKSNGEKYTAVLGLTDIQQQKNSFYKLQLLQADSGNKFWLFRSWGRIGTSIGNTKVENLDLHEAKQQFNALYLDKTGNSWEDRNNFVKKPGCMYPIDLDYGDELAEAKLDIGDNLSKLSEPVQKLIKLIFDVDLMKKVMLEFELDTEKMPLGKLSKSQLHDAYGVLSELQTLVESDGSLPRLIDATNRFYTFVPHSFGVENPPVINDLETIKKKVEMVENLMEMEIAYSMMKSTGSNNTIDGHYQQLKTDLDVLKCEADEFAIISEYVKNTHAETHSNYELEIEDVFTVKRQGEEKRYKPFRKLKNRKLLWHGSRTTNLAGILSQGLRIAPPEAPVTGYMFGKGIYFADMVSKSANYCCTTPSNNTGVLLLCEVALGEMYELANAKYVEKLPKGKHSVKGVGRTEPDPKYVKELPDGVHVPLGKGVELKKSKSTSLLYNEYIVYDIAQVNIKYLLKLNFKYKY